VIRGLHFVAIVLVVLAFIVLARSSSPVAAAADSTTTQPASPLAYEDSAFGVFAAFASPEFGYFKRRTGFTDDDYLAWASVHMRDLGAHWTRSNLQLVWDIIEPKTGGGYHWNNPLQTDLIVNAIYRPGNEVNWLGVFHEGSGPNRTVFEMDKPMLRNPLDHPREYKAFVRAVVERYGGSGTGDTAPGPQVKYWQAGNEAPMWRDSGRTVADYVRFVRMIRQAAREADPSAKIVLIAPTDGFRVDPLLAETIAELAPNHEFDAIDVHHWGSVGNWRMTAVPEYRRLLDSKGLKDVQIWSCEHGTWQGAPSEEPAAQTEQEQARSLVKRYVYNLNNGLDKLFWNNLMEWERFSGREGSIFNSMGLVTDGQGPGENPARFCTPRVAYWTYKMLAGRIDTHVSKPLGKMNGVYREGEVYAYSYLRRDTGKRLHIIWSEIGPETVTLLVDSKSVRVTDLIADPQGETKTKDVRATDDRVTLELRADPLLVEET